MPQKKLISAFSQHLAAGLSALYFAVPRSLACLQAEHKERLCDADVAGSEQLCNLVRSLRFCDRVADAAHSLVRQQLLHFIYQGFLVPVFATPLWQGDDSEVITATSTFELFLRNTQNAELRQCFVDFLLLPEYDGVNICSFLITRLLSEKRKTRLVTLSLFHTLLSLYNERLMWDLVFSHVVPNSPEILMASQMAKLGRVDVSGESARAFLALTPLSAVGVYVDACGMTNGEAMNNGNDATTDDYREHLDCAAEDIRYARYA